MKMSLNKARKLYAEHPRRFSRALIEALLHETGQIDPIILGDGTIVEWHPDKKNYVELRDPAMALQAFVRADLHLERLTGEPSTAGLEAIVSSSGKSRAVAERIYNEKREIVHDWVSDDVLIEAGELVRDRLRDRRLISRDD